MLIQLLDSIAIKTDKCYIINNNVYKKGIFNETVAAFLIECTPYYHVSKRKYLEKKSTYNSFITIIIFYLSLLSSHQVGCRVECSVV